LKFFKDEPNVPTSWQHILNWGGLRGVIPLVLVYSLPDSYQLKDWMLSFTLGSFLFTLFVNGLTIQWLLKRLKLHLPKKSEHLVNLQNSLLRLEEQQDIIKNLLPTDFGKDNLEVRREQIRSDIAALKSQIIEEADSTFIEKSLRLAGLMKERSALERLHRDGHVSGRVYQEFEIELDLQADAVEYPLTFADGTIDHEGRIRSGRSFRHRLYKLRDQAAHMPFLRGLFRVTEEQLTMERIELLNIRIWTSKEAIGYLERIKSLLSDRRITKMVNRLIDRHGKLIAKNQAGLEALSNSHSDIISAMQAIRLEKVL
jgi:CPA1 family monovalent cation:H+ antiporter